TAQDRRRAAPIPPASSPAIDKFTATNSGPQKENAIQRRHAICLHAYLQHLGHGPISRGGPGRIALGLLACVHLQRTSTHKRANPWWRSGGTYQEKREEFGQQGVSNELSNDPAAGAGHAVDERFRHHLPFRPAHSRVRARERGERYR
ncbi:hypothetical protein BHE74_00041718, partial [Ensete ventricosum]